MRKAEPDGYTSRPGYDPESAAWIDGLRAGGRNLYVETGAAGIVDEFSIDSDGTLTPIGSVTVPGTVGGEGIAAS